MDATHETSFGANAAGDEPEEVTIHLFTFLPLTLKFDQSSNSIFFYETVSSQALHSRARVHG